LTSGLRQSAPVLRRDTPVNVTNPRQFNITPNSVRAANALLYADVAFFNIALLDRWRTTVRPSRVFSPPVITPQLCLILTTLAAGLSQSPILSSQ
jgi:hypothetical protein